MSEQLSDVTADYTSETLSTPAQLTAVEEGEKLQSVRMGDDGSEERVSFSSTSRFYVKIQWAGLPPETAGTIFDLYHDTAKANGMENSFYWDNPWDDETYTVRFESKVPRTIGPKTVQAFKNVTLRVLGNQP